jgi:pimeloyl-ACP methyl ester carboxylesterase
MRVEQAMQIMTEMAPQEFRVTVDGTPQNSGDTIDIVWGVGKYFQRDDAIVSDTELLGLSGLMDYLIEHSRIENDFTVIDLGSGRGLFSVYLAREYPDSTVHAVDLCPPWFEKNYENGQIEPTDSIQYFDVSDQADNLDCHVGDLRDLLGIDFIADVGLLVNIWHHPGVLIDDRLEGVEDDALKKVEMNLMNRFRYIISNVNKNQYDAYRSGHSYYNGKDQQVEIVEEFFGHNQLIPELIVWRAKS